MKNQKKIAIFGGSFNPIHRKHVKIIRSILERINEVWIIPCKNHALDKSLANEKDRLEMIKLAVEGIENVKISRIELENKEKSYTLKTLNELEKEYPEFKFFIVIGADILHELDKWYEYKELLEKAEFIIHSRNGYPIKNIQGMKILTIIEDNDENISSTEVRNKIQQEKSISNLVPIKVESYILKNKLYTSPEQQNLNTTLKR